MTPSEETRRRIAEKLDSEVQEYPMKESNGNITWFKVVDYEAAKELLAEYGTELSAENARLREELTFHGHRIEERRNDGQHGMPQGRCECTVCKPFYTELSETRSKLAEVTDRLYEACTHDEWDHDICLYCGLQRRP